MRRKPSQKKHDQRQLLESATTDSNIPGNSGAEREGLDLALDRSQAVKAKVDGVAEELGVTNQSVKQRIAAGKFTVPARQSLNHGERMESTVKEVADDLGEVNDVLSQGVKQLEITQTALADARQTLLQTEDALAGSQRQEEVSRHRALHDSLTGLPNHELFNDRLTQAIAMAERHAWTLAVMFLDLDRFKQINDEHGHAAGDAVLKATARRLLRNSRDEDTVCRLGGDEFLVMLVNPKGAGTPERIAHDILEEIRAPIEMDGISLSVSASIGIACFPEHATTGVQLVAHADAAMYTAKRGGAGVRIWSDAEPGSASVDEVEIFPQKAGSSSPKNFGHTP